MRLISHIESAHSARPKPSSSRIGTRDDSRPDRGDAKNDTTLIGRKRRPVCSGE